MYLSAICAADNNTPVVSLFWIDGILRAEEHHVYDISGPRAFEVAALTGLQVGDKRIEEVLGECGEQRGRCRACDGFGYPLPETIKI